MSAPVNTGSFAKGLFPGINAWYGAAYTEHKEQWSDLVTAQSSSRNYEEDMGYSGFGLAAIKTEGGSIQYDTESQAFLTRYDHLVYGKGFIVTREAVEDDLYDIVAKRQARTLAFAMRQTKENVVAGIYNRAFNSSYVGGDGVSLLNSAHPRHKGGTWSNTLSTAADLSEASLEQACIDIMNYTDDAGLRISVMPQSLHIPVNLNFEAARILTSNGRTGTDSNDRNILSDMGKFPGGATINQYFTDQDAWFIRTNVQHGMKLFQRRKMEFTTDNDFDTENAKFKATERYSAGWSDPRGLYGSPGA